MARLPKIYYESSCFIEIAKHEIKTHDPQRADDIWHMWALLNAAKDGKVQVLTSTLTIAECVHADESTSGLPSDKVKKQFRSLLLSGQYVHLIQDTVLIAERARDLRWQHKICMKGPDAVHAASAMELQCDEFFSFDGVYIRKKQDLKAIDLKVCLPRSTTCLPSEYRQGSLLPAIV